MRVQDINNEGELLRKRLAQGLPKEIDDLLECRKCFVEAWDIKTHKWADMVAASMSKAEGQDSYNLHNISAELIKSPAEYEDIIRSLFGDLLNQNKDLMGRVQRWQFGWSEINSNLHRTTRKMPSFQSDLLTISIYLSLVYPDEYIPYNLQGMNAFLKKVGARAPLQPYDYERYAKLTKTIYTILCKNEKLTLEYNNAKRDKANMIINDNMLIALLIHQY